MDFLEEARRWAAAAKDDGVPPSAPRAAAAAAPPPSDASPYDGALAAEAAAMQARALEFKARADAAEARCVVLETALDRYSKQGNALENQLESLGSAVRDELIKISDEVEQAQAEAADLRRQLVAAQETIATLEAAAVNSAAAVKAREDAAAGSWAAREAELLAQVSTLRRERDAATAALEEARAQLAAAIATATKQAPQAVVPPSGVPQQGSVASAPVAAPVVSTAPSGRGAARVASHFAVLCTLRDAVPGGSGSTPTAGGVHVALESVTRRGDASDVGSALSPQRGAAATPHLPPHVEATQGASATFALSDEGTVRRVRAHAAFCAQLDNATEANVTLARIAGAVATQPGHQGVIFVAAPATISDTVGGSVLQSVVSALFDALTSGGSRAGADVTISLLDVYNELVRDALAITRTPPSGNSGGELSKQPTFSAPTIAFPASDAAQDGSGKVTPPSMAPTRVAVSAVTDAQLVLRAALKNRSLLYESAAYTQASAADAPAPSVAGCPVRGHTVAVLRVAHRSEGGATASGPTSKLFIVQLAQPGYIAAQVMPTLTPAAAAALTTESQYITKTFNAVRDVWRHSVNAAASSSSGASDLTQDLSASIAASPLTACIAEGLQAGGADMAFHVETLPHLQYAHDADAVSHLLLMEDVWSACAPLAPATPSATLFLPTLTPGTTPTVAVSPTVAQAQLRATMAGAAQTRALYESGMLAQSHGLSTGAHGSSADAHQEAAAPEGGRMRVTPYVSSSDAGGGGDRVPHMIGMPPGSSAQRHMALQPTHVVYERQAGGGGEGARSRSTSASRRPTSRGRTAAPLTDAPAPLFAPAREGGRRQGSLSRAFYSTKGGQEALATSARSSRTPSRASSVVGPSYDAASAVGVHNTSLASTARGRSARRPSIGSVSAITGVSTPYMGSVVGPSTMTAAPSIGGRVVDVDALAGVSSYVDPYARRRQADDARRAMGDRASSARRGSRSSFISLEEYVARDGPAAAAAHLVSHDAHASAPREDALNSSRWTDVKSMSVTGRRSVGAGMVPPYATATASSRRLASVSPPTASGARANRAGAARAPTTLHAAPSRRSGAPASSQFGDGGPYAQPAVLPTAPAPQQARRQQGAYDEEEEWSRSASARHGAQHDARTDSRYETVRDAHDAERAAHRAAYAPTHEVRAASFRGASHDAPRQQLQRGFEQETGFQPSVPAATHGAFSASRAPAYGPAAGAAAHVNHFATGATPPSPKQTYTHAETSRARQSSAPPHAGGHELRELQALDSALREEAIQNEMLTSSVRSPPALRRASAASTGEREASHGQGTPLVMATTGMMLSPVPHVQSVGDPVPGMRNLIALFVARGFEWTDANFGALSEALGTCDVTQRGALDEAAFAYALRKYAPFITGGEVASIMQQMCLEGSTDIDYHDFVDALRSLAISDGYWRSE